jgi:hypothetical protein
MKMSMVLYPLLHKTYFTRNSGCPGIRGKENMSAVAAVISKSAILALVPRVCFKRAEPCPV